MAENKLFTAHRAELIKVREKCLERAYVELEIPIEAAAVVKVTFTVLARDQGWSTPGEANSYTWFDAAVRRPAGRPDLGQVEIVKNKLNHPYFLEQTVSWDLSSDPRQRTWVQNLQPGDVVQVLPKAKYMAWVNRIQECRITAECKPVGEAEAEAVPPSAHSPTQTLTGSD